MKKIVICTVLLSFCLLGCCGSEKKESTTVVTPDGRTIHSTTTTIED